MYSTGFAYILWLVSGFGAMGFHRFYLNKIGSGILYLFTGGLFGIGSIYDLVTLPRQVREANMRLSFEHARELGYRQGRQEGATFRNVSQSARKEPIEKLILRVAQKSDGIVTPATVSLEGDISLEEAKKQLEKLVSSGFAEMRVKKNGGIVFFFPELAPDASYRDFEDL